MFVELGAPIPRGVKLTVVKRGMAHCGSSLRRLKPKSLNELVVEARLRAHIGKARLGDRETDTPPMLLHKKKS